MPSVTKSIDVAAPVSIAYNQWTQFETFPHFMGGVDSIEQLDVTRLHWVTSVGGVKREFDAEITEQRPDERIAWRSSDGIPHSGVVTFEALADNECKVTVELEWQAEGVVEHTGALLGADDYQVRADMERFRDYLEDKGHADGGWRGEVS